MMKLSEHATLAVTRADRVFRPVVRLTRPLRNATWIAALTTVPRFAQAATGGEAHVPMVMTAFSVIVAAAIATSIAAALSRGEASVRLADSDYSDGAYVPDPHVRQYSDR